MKKPIGIFGGTFDPIHKGHLLVANRVLEFGNFAEIRFVPCKIPVHKQSLQASTKQRQKMIDLAISSQKELILDDREIQRETPSFMIETLQSFRDEYPDTSLVLIIGMDSFLDLLTWWNWKLLIKYAHILVVARPGFQLQWNDELAKEFKSKISTNINDLSNQLAGVLYFFELDALPISSTEIRQQIKAGIISKQLLPETVVEYIEKEKIYF